MTNVWEFHNRRFLFLLSSTGRSRSRIGHHLNSSNKRTIAVYSSVVSAISVGHIDNFGPQSMSRLGKHKHRPLPCRLKQLGKECVVVGPQPDGILGHAVRTYPQVRGSSLLVAFGIGLVSQGKSDVASSKATAVLTRLAQIQHRLRRLLQCVIDDSPG